MILSEPICKCTQVSQVYFFSAAAPLPDVVKKKNFNAVCLSDP